MLVFIGRPEFPVLGWVHMSNKLWLWVSIYMHAAYRVEEPRTFLTASHGMRRLGDKAGGTDKRERERGTNNFPRTVRPRFFCHPRERTRLLRRTSKQIWDRSQPRDHRTPCLFSYIEPNTDVSNAKICTAILLTNPRWILNYHLTRGTTEFERLLLLRYGSLSQTVDKRLRFLISLNQFSAILLISARLDFNSSGS